MHLIDLFDRGVRIAGDRLAFSGFGGKLTYREAQALTYRIANALARDGFGPGDRFAGLSPNHSLTMTAILGGYRAGAVWCNLNLRNAVDANIDILKRGDCRILFYHSVAAEAAQAIRQACPNIKLAMTVDQPANGDPTLMDWLGDVPATDPGRRHPEDEIGFQGATGGTTGASKLTLSANRFVAHSVAAWSTCLHFPLKPPVNLAVAPITHAAGFVAMGLMPMGGHTIMASSPDIGEMLRTIEQEKVSVLFLPPTLIYMLLAHPGVREHDTSSLKYLISAAAPLSPAKIKEAIEVLGPVICQAFGQTESGFPTTWMSPEEYQEAAATPALEHRLMSCGRPTLVAERIEIMADDGTLLGPDETGEMVMRGPNEMLGYRDDPVATEEIKKFGWHHTGDIGHRDADGYLYVTDRKRDMIVSGGFNIFPFEIESVLTAHPAVQDCAVIGVPDEKWGEAVKAVVQLAPGATAEPEELMALCREKLGGMKTPKSVEIWPDLPRSAVGKVLKREIRKPFWEGQGRAVG